MTPALLIAGHGSRDPDGVAEFLDLARHFRAHQPGVPLEIGFLDFLQSVVYSGICLSIRRLKKERILQR